MKKQPRLVLRTTAYPSIEDLQPFINGHQKINNANSNEKSAVDLPEMSSLIPVNAENLRISKEYRKQLPLLMNNKLELTQNFFLHEVAPSLLALSNGLQDAKEILETTLDEKSDTDNLFHKIENAVGLALDVKIMNFAISVIGLDVKEAKEFKLLAFSKEMGSTNENLIGQLLKVFSVHDVPGAKKGAKVPVRGLPKTEGNGQRRRPSRPGARTKG